MLQLISLMLERAGILLILAFMLSRMKSFRRIIHNEHGWKEKWMLIAVFGIFGIISNYTGIQIEHSIISSQAWHTDVNAESAIANTRIMGVVIGGLLGGPFVGAGVGLIAGTHRFLLGGFTSVACGISTMLAGLLTGMLGVKYRARNPNSPLYAAMIGILMESVQMFIILLVAKPLSSAWELVQLIALPMIIVNGFGIWMFMIMIQSIFQEEERSRAWQTHKVLSIADQTMPYFRQGLNAVSCEVAAKIILKETNADAISLTNKQTILAHVGAGCDHHVASRGITTQLTKLVLQEGILHVARMKEQIQCPYEGCPLQAAIVIPLQVHGAIAGTLKLYFTKASKLDPVAIELAEGLSKLFSTQLELAEMEHQSRLLKDAEIRALQAQVHPHFLFNAINTISVLCRRDPEQARILLLQLSTFFRSNLQGARSVLIPLYKELEHVEAYLSLEQARFPNKYSVEFEIDPELKEVRIPPFTLQPLVENAIRHAFGKGFKEPKGQVVIRAWREGERMILTTTDNGIGIEPEVLERLGREEVPSCEGTGTVILNISKRVEELYNREASFHIDSHLGKGTTVTLVLPIHYSEREED